MGGKMTAKYITQEQEEVKNHENHEILGIRSQLKMVTFYRKGRVSYPVSYSHLLSIDATENLIRLDSRKVQVVVKGSLTNSSCAGRLSSELPKGVA